MLQLQGKKKWRIHAPCGVEYPSTLHREYSRDFTPSEVKEKMKLLGEFLLEEGDMLYIPRGVVHFGIAVESDKGEKADKATGDKKSDKKQVDFSHHLTVSTYMKSSIFDLLAEALPDALQKAYNADERYRKGLPLDFMSSFGVLQQEDGSRKNVGILIFSVTDICVSIGGARM
jgi:hypothetical protein